VKRSTSKLIGLGPDLTDQCIRGLQTGENASSNCPALSSERPRPNPAVISSIIVYVTPVQHRGEMLFIVGLQRFALAG